MPRRFHTISLVALASLVCAVLAAIPVRAGAGEGPAPVDRPVLRATGRTSALVHVVEGAALRDGIAAARAAGLETGTVYDAIGVFVAYGSATEFSELAKAPSIAYVEANRRMRLFSDTSHGATRGQDVLDGAVTLAGGATIDGTGVGVAVVDTGVDGTHPDLAPRMGGNVKMVCTVPLIVNGPEDGFTECRGPKTAVELEDTDHASPSGHGTHVAGIVAGTGEASAGEYHGAAPGVTLYGVGMGTVVLPENGLDGLAWVLANHDQVSPPIKVVNTSWGTSYSKYQPSGDPTYSATWKLQEELVEAGLTVVVSAGNGAGTGTAATTSAQCVNPTPGIVCVANYDDQGTGTRAGTIDPGSSRGSTSDVESWPDVSAPGTLITSTCRMTLPICHLHDGMLLDPPNRYATLTGTSMAAPHVAGIAAQLYQADPSITPAEIENVLEDTAHKFAFGAAYGLLTDATNPDDTSSYEKGHGLVDALAAVEAVLNAGTTPTPSPSPTATPTAPPPSGTRYYFQTATWVGEADGVSSGSTFDSETPAALIYAEWRDLPRSNERPADPFDPHWTGRVDGPIEGLTLDFWAKTPVGEELGTVSYRPVVWVGDDPYVLPTLTVPMQPSLGNVPTRLTRSYTTMLDAAGNEVPLAIDPGDDPVTISIGGISDVDGAGSWISYGTEDYPSGFVVHAD